MRSKDRVAVAWIDGGQVDSAFCESMIALFRWRSERISSIIRISGALLSRQRNQVVASFLDDNDADWLFFIDSDETITAEAFDKICAAAHDKDRPIVAGLYFGAFDGPDAYPTPVPMIMRMNDTGRYNPVRTIPADAVIPIDAAGTGALLIHRSVLLAMREDSLSSPSVAQHEAGIWCWFRDMPVAGEWFGEDIYFCRRARDLGFPMVAATGARLGHHKHYWLTDRQFHAAPVERAVQRPPIEKRG